MLSTLGETKQRRSFVFNSKSKDILNAKQRMVRVHNKE